MLVPDQTLMPGKDPKTTRQPQLKPLFELTVYYTVKIYEIKPS